MRTIYAKVLLWALGTVAVSLAAFGAISILLIARSGPPDFFLRTVDHLRDEAIFAHEAGGRDGLAAYLRRLDARYPAEHHLTDARGVDLLTGEDRSAQIAAAEARPSIPPRPVDGKLILANASADGRFRFITEVRQQFDPWGILPYYGAIVLVIALLGYALSAHLVRPIRRLRRAVDRFGRGDLTARDGSTRRDEIGDLARAFDEMAARIGTLLDAEHRLLQDVSHELRSPITRLCFALEMARAGAEGDREAGLDQIAKETGRLAALVDELLRLNRSEGDALDRDLGAVDLGDLIRALAEDGRFEAAAKGSGLAVRAEAGLVVVGERELLRRAVENVLRNAIRHAPEGTAVDLDLHRDTGSAVIRVRDRGPGVPEGLREAIFEPFYRVGEDRSRLSGGVGLGLAIARRAVNLHRGRIEARDAGPGLLVTIELPLAD